MGRSADRYWDLDEARWVASPAPVDASRDGDVPAQRTGLEEVEEADVRSR